jgi:hypothetical protein
LEGFDPDRKLSKPGGEATMVSNAKITKQTNITATLVIPSFKDDSIQNNTMTKTLDIQPTKLQPVYQMRQ